MCSILTPENIAQKFTYEMVTGAKENSTCSISLLHCIMFTHHTHLPLQPGNET